MVDSFQVEQLYLDGLSCKSIAIRLGVAASSIVHHLKKRNVSRRLKRHDWNDEQLHDLYTLKRMTVDEIGCLLGISGKVVNKRLRKIGVKMRPRGQKFGCEHKGWKGGKTIDKSGYVLSYHPDHPNANRSGYIREHRVVMESIVGRFLTKEEVVHHIDGNKLNNCPSNLKLYQSNGEHLAETLRGKTPNWTEDGLRRLRQSIARQRSTRGMLRQRARASR